MISNRGRREAASASRKARYALGLMAGTSGDGIDAATIRVEGAGERMHVRFVAHHQRAFGRELRRRLLAAMAPAETTTQEIARLHADLGEAFGRVAREAIAQLPRRERPGIVGLAGQTVCHLPGRPGKRTVTLQLGNAALVSAMTDLPVVFDFRQSDVAAGGQGAPLVPWTDYVLFRNPRVSRAIQNIGGIGNVTWIPAGAWAADVIAFDTGPGNMIIDGLAALATSGRQRMDRDGRMAARGRVLETVLTAWMAHPFLRQRPPRTTGRETFGVGFIRDQMEMLRSASGRAEDWLATATAYTARTIASSYRQFLPAFSRDLPRSKGGPRRVAGRIARASKHPIEVVLTGGGGRNQTLSASIQSELTDCQVLTIDHLGIPAEAKEAVSFAMLAIAAADGVPSNLRAATGAGQTVPLGSICYRYGAAKAIL